MLCFLITLYLHLCTGTFIKTTYFMDAETYEYV